MGGEHPGEYVIPNRKNTHFAWIDSLKRGRLFQITYKSQLFYRPPGCNLGGKCEVNFGNYNIDDVVGVGAEFEIDGVRCGIIWDGRTRTSALMLAVGFYPRHRDRKSTKIWTNVGRMELQTCRWGPPGTQNYFAYFRDDDECADDKVPDP